VGCECVSLAAGSDISSGTCAEGWGPCDSRYCGGTVRRMDVTKASTRTAFPIANAKSSTHKDIRQVRCAAGCAA